MTATFSHTDAGTPESLWRGELARRSLPPLDLAVDVLIVVAAHPDDETLGAAGLIGRMSRAGAKVVVVVATDGEASHPRSPTHDPRALAQRRREEVRRAVSVLSPSAAVHFLGLPDGRLGTRAERLRESLTALLDALRVTERRRVLIASPWEHDRHGDHRVTAQTVSALARRRRLVHVEYPIWAWHWGGPENLPWERALGLELDGDAYRLKREAIACHTSQTEPLSDLPGDEALLHPGMQEHFDRDIEVFLAPVGADAQSETVPSAWFDAFYRRNPGDPWGFETRWYEQRKRMLLLASLPVREIGAVLEIGCSTGLLTEELAARARSVVAMDAAEPAVRAARERLASRRHVTVRRGAVPADWTEGRFDAIVLSEVGYYLSTEDLRHTLDRIDAALTENGFLVACHWRHPVELHPQTGDEVHRVLRSMAGWETTVRHEERDFVLEVFAREPARSVAEAEGLV